MTRERILTLANLLVALLLFGAAGALARPAPALIPLSPDGALGNEFTYQGRLTDSGHPTKGVFDLRFKLFDAADGGTQIGGTVMREDLVVEDGLFTTKLDFGAAFEGNARYVEISIRPGQSTGDFIMLMPRQALTAVPYALYALNIPLAGSGSSVSAARSDHDHAGRYVSIAGDTMAGALSVPSLRYTVPRTHYYTIGGEGFVPNTNVNYVNGGNIGGAYIESGVGLLVAPVHLPQGAVVTKFTVHFVNNGTPATASLYRLPFAGTYQPMAGVTANNINGWGSSSDTTIDNPTVDNTQYSYVAHVYSMAWSSSLEVRAAVIEYAINSAE